MGTTVPVEKEAYSPKEVAALLGVDYETVARWLRSGQIPSFKIENTRRVHRRALDEVMGLTGGTTRERYPEPEPPVKPDELADWG